MPLHQENAPASEMLVCVEGGFQKQGLLESVSDHDSVKELGEENARIPRSCFISLQRNQAGSGPQLPAACFPVSTCTSCRKRCTSKGPIYKLTKGELPKALLLSREKPKSFNSQVSGRRRRLRSRSPALLHLPLPSQP